MIIFQHIFNQLFNLLFAFNGCRLGVKNIIFFNGDLQGYLCTGLCCLEEYCQTALDFRFKLFGYESFNSQCRNMVVEGA